MDNSAQVPTKSVASCEKPGGDACSLRAQDTRITPKGGGTQGSKAFQYLQEKKPIGIPLVGATEHGTGQTEFCMVTCKRCGVVAAWVQPFFASRSLLENSTTERESRVRENNFDLIHVLSSRTGHEKPCLNPAGPPAKAKYHTRSIVN